MKEEQVFTGIYLSNEEGEIPRFSPLWEEGDSILPNCDQGKYALGFSSQRL